MVVLKPDLKLLQWLSYQESSSICLLPLASGLCFTKRIRWQRCCASFWHLSSENAKFHFCFFGHSLLDPRHDAVRKLGQPLERLMWGGPEEGEQRCQLVSHVNELSQVESAPT